MMVQIAKRILAGLLVILALFTLFLIIFSPHVTWAEMLVMEVSDRSALYMVDVNRGMTVPLIRGRAESPAWSPQGDRIAYLLAAEQIFGNAGIYVTDAYGQQQLELAAPTPGMEYNHPVWSPDGTQLVYAARDLNLSFNHSLYLVNADGSGLRQLTSPATDSIMPNWSPDGKQIIFSMYRGTTRINNPNIWVVDAHCDQQPGGCNQNMRRLSNVMAARYPTWSPDGRRIAFIYGDYNQLWVMEADGSRPRSVVSREGLLWFNWSPDSERIIYAASTGMRLWRLGIVEVESGRAHTLDSTRNAVAPAWSPDGQRIAFLGVDRRRFNIYVMDHDGGNLRQITGRGTDGFRFSWSPSSQ